MTSSKREERNSHSIGMFDSGVGGLTVMQQLMQTMPHEHIIYFADTARLPYGEKSPETIIRYSIENAHFLIEKNIKMLVISCNTATAHALKKLQEILAIPVIGVIEPGAEHAVKTSKNQRIAILATKGTIRSKVYEQEIHRRLPHATLFPIACPLFVPLVEEQFVHHPATLSIVQEYLQPLKDKQIDTVILGCTHYPLLRGLIQQEMGPGVAIIDSAVSCAEKVSELLHSCHLQTTETQKPCYQFFASDDPEGFHHKRLRFLNKT